MLAIAVGLVLGVLAIPLSATTKYYDERSAAFTIQKHFYKKRTKTIRAQLARGLAALVIQTRFRLSFARRWREDPKSIMIGF